MGLFIDGFGDPVVTMPDANGENAAKEIQEFFAVGIINVVIFGVIDHQGLIIIGGDARKKIFFLLVDDLLFVQFVTPAPIVPNGIPFDILKAYVTG